MDYVRFHLRVAVHRSGSRKTRGSRTSDSRKIGVLQLSEIEKKPLFSRAPACERVHLRGKDASSLMYSCECPGPSQCSRPCSSVQVCPPTRETSCSAPLPGH